MTRDDLVDQKSRSREFWVVLAIVTLATLCYFGMMVVLGWPAFGEGGLYFP